jgi:hypothetical protein
MNTIVHGISNCTKTPSVPRIKLIYMIFFDCIRLNDKILEVIENPLIS